MWFSGLFSHPHQGCSEHKTYCSSLSMVCVLVCECIFAFRTQCCLPTLCCTCPARMSLVVMVFVNYGGGRYWFFKHESWNGKLLLNWLASCSVSVLSLWCIEFIFFHYRSDCCWSGVCMVSAGHAGHFLVFRKMMKTKMFCLLSILNPLLKWFLPSLVALGLCL